MDRDVDSQLVAEQRRGTSDRLLVAVVEDDPDHALLAAEALEERGHRTVSFSRAADALAAHRPREWDAVVLDYRLPDMSGLEVLDRLLSSADPPPVVMATASGNEELAVAAMKRGAADYVVKTGTHGVDLAHAVELAAVKQRLQRAVVLYQQELERRANTDALTGLINRYRLTDELRSAATRAVQDREPYAVAMLDIDGFKHINDSRGHAAGDALLVDFANLLRRHTRKQDILARYGGDEFVIVLPGCDQDSCQPVLSRIREAIADLHAGHSQTSNSASIGVADSSAGDPEDVLMAADRAMYRDKGGPYVLVADHAVGTGRPVATSGRQEAKAALDPTVSALASTLQRHDSYTAGHQQRVADLATALARGVGLSEREVDAIRVAAVFHDLGKLLVPAEILVKPGKLSEVEVALLRQHPVVGHQIIQNVPFDQPIAETILQHHERCDGSGYPRGLAGSQILLSARVLAVADVVEAMASHRPYRPAPGLAAALEELSRFRGIRYDPDVVDACLLLFREGRFDFGADLSASAGSCSALTPVLP